MRVLHLASPVQAFDTHSAHVLAAMTARRGFEVALAGPPDTRPDSTGNEQAMKWHQLDDYPSRPLADLQMRLRIRQLIAGADIVHVHGSAAAQAAHLALIGRKSAPRLVYSLPEATPAEGAKRTAAARHFDRWVATRMDVIVVGSRAASERARKNLGENAPVTVIESCLDQPTASVRDIENQWVRVWSPEFRQREVRVELGLDQAAGSNPQRVWDAQARHPVAGGSRAIVRDRTIA